jgi:hypothetical protein
MKTFMPALLGVCALIGIGATLSMRAQPSDRATAAQKRYEAALAELRTTGAAGPAVKSFLEGLPRVDGLLVVEGDMLMTDQEAVQNYLTTQVARGVLKPGPELKINVLPSGALDRYDASHRTLTYAVDRGSFSQGTTFQMIVNNMTQATAAWQDACPVCGLEFIHRADQDAAASTAQVNFVVRNFDAHGEYIAASFFPHDAPARRFLNLDPSYYSTTYDKTGVLRHELGHVLGYRHEHIEGVPGCYRDPLEDRHWLPLTNYDSKSVMHYFCGGGGSLTLELTPTDIRGHRSAYELH